LDRAEVEGCIRRIGSEAGLLQRAMKKNPSGKGAHLAMARPMPTPNAADPYIAERFWNWVGRGRFWKSGMDSLRDPVSTVLSRRFPTRFSDL
jgi:hypothetical protein